MGERGEVGGIPAAGLVEADVGEDQGAALGQLRPPGRLPREVHHGGAGMRGAGDQRGERLGQIMAVGGHGTVALGGDRDGQRRVEVGEASRGGEVDALLVRHGVPHPVGVGVVPEAGHQPGAQAQARGGGGEVGDPAGARAHALGPQLLPGPGQAVHAGEHDVEEHRAGQQHVQRRVVLGALGGQRVPVLALGGLGRRGGGSAGGELGGVVCGICRHLSAPSSIPRMKCRGEEQEPIGAHDRTAAVLR